MKTWDYRFFNFHASNAITSCHTLSWGSGLLAFISLQRRHILWAWALNNPLLLLSTLVPRVFVPLDQRSWNGLPVELRMPSFQMNDQRTSWNFTSGHLYCLSNQSVSCNGTFESRSFHQACGVRNEDSRYKIGCYLGWDNWSKSKATPRERITNFIIQCSPMKKACIAG